MTSIPATSGIYMITCTVTGKFYIGSTCNLHNRLYEHFRMLRNGTHSNSKLQAAFNKYGEQSFLREIIELVLPPFLLEREQYWLDKLKPALNIASNTQAAHQGLKHTQASIDKMSANRRGKSPHNLGKKGYYKASPETCKKLSQMRLGHGVSLETRKKLAQANTGNKNCLGREQSLKSREQISQTRLGDKILIATSPEGTDYIVTVIREFCRDHNLNSSLLIQVAKGKRHHTQGWTARYVDRD